LKENSRDPLGFAPLPIGPAGRKTMFNGLTDSIYARTPTQGTGLAVAALPGFPAMRNHRGQAGVIYPAVPAGTKTSQARMAKDGIDISAFVSEAKPGVTFPFPISDHASEIEGTMKSTMDTIFLGRSKAARP
jgi:multiple sugar transport system substrate-binding protein